MGLGRLEEIADGLLDQGLDPGTPTAVISCGTTAEQEVAVATLDGIAGAAAGLPAPALVVVGDVVSLSAQLAAARGTLAAA
jgi:siroheme synthase